MKKRWACSLLSAALLLTLTACGQGNPQTNGGGTGTSTSTAAHHSSYPEKPLVVVAPSGAGGGWDKTARSLAKVLVENKQIDQPVTVENKPGGGGVVFLSEYVTKDKGNDYRLFVNSPPLLINHRKKEGNSPFGYEDVTPLAQLTKDFGAIVVPADSPYENLKQLLEELKADPAKLTMAGGSAPGSMDHLIAVLPAAKYGIDPKAVKYVSYDGGGEAMAALLGGNADAIATDASSLGEYLKAGRIRVLGVSSDQRLGGHLADIPTFKEQGIDASFTIWRGVFGPPEMSAEAVAFWDKTLEQLAASDSWQAELQRNAWESEYRNATEFKTFLAEQDRQINELLQSLGMAK
ncbi:MAG: tripartite tricarboxylate transporter substrate binding protein [Brevibacillus sp.]|nr:tripartite tricarboxylate transporter substrate binding protein [Brevibacillus sp.]